MEEYRRKRGSAAQVLLGMEMEELGSLAVREAAKGNAKRL